MDHVVYLDIRAKELEHLAQGTKKMIIRGAMGRKMPYGRVHAKDTLYFIENKGDGLVKAKATVSEVIETEKLAKEESIAMVERHQESLRLDAGLQKRFAGKRYLVLIRLEDVSMLDPFSIDRTAYGNMDDWLPVEQIDRVRISR